jgi:hypothetical protein
MVKRIWVTPNMHTNNQMQSIKPYEYSTKISPIKHFFSSCVTNQWTSFMDTTNDDKCH